jgi:hypothetical protein
MLAYAELWIITWCKFRCDASWGWIVHNLGTYEELSRLNYDHCDCELSLQLNLLVSKPPDSMSLTWTACSTANPLLSRTFQRCSREADTSEVLTLDLCWQMLQCTWIGDGGLGRERARGTAILCDCVCHHWNHQHTLVYTSSSADLSAHDSRSGLIFSTLYSWLRNHG